MSTQELLDLSVPFIKIVSPLLLILMAFGVADRFVDFIMGIAKQVKGG